MILYYLLFKVSFLGILMSSIVRMKYGVRKSVFLIVTYSAVILILNYVIYILKGLDFLSGIFPLSASLPMFVFFCLVSSSSIPKVLFSLLTVTICGTLTSFIGTMAAIYFGNVALRLAAEFVCAVLVLAFIILVFRKPYLRMTDMLKSGWALLCLVPGLLIALVYILQYYPAPLQDRTENILPILLVFALMFVLYSIIYLNFRNISEYYELKNDRKAISIQTEMYRKEYEAIQGNVDSLRIFRHDMRHHMNAITMFLRDNNISEARKYISKMEGSLSDSIMGKYCENYGVNAILSSLIYQARNEQIEVDCEASIPERIGIDSMELGLVFANALDNAINACRKLNNLSKRRIKVVCREHGSLLYIRVSNPYEGTVHFNGEFPVSVGSDHGIGTKSIAAIVEKHGGVFLFTAQDGVFKMTVTLNHD